ncbi:uncharacterized protein LY79DRAFT_670984 [Colletotrichum navitas]|uniref:Uncharacterized protein n=1 Tax=Colletotrichum navitas TaxID=681940 RepID=A0AAD8PVQ0_9PEZI|nr:uncharacterized protein LY79DRAFT_670984 [Colletotrichum navitas]KAK1585589.1 hypothetical protein LY79DRAFT_670984 [Colletotrichum navitas]
MGFMTFSSWRASFASLFVLLTLVLGAAAQSLGLALDEAVLDDANLVCYSKKLTFEQDASELFNDGQLYGLAKLAFEEMRTKFQGDGIRSRRQPGLMAAMAVGKDIYLTSDVEGGSFLYTYAGTGLNPDVVLALERCQTALQQDTDLPVDQQHRAKASCAGVFAVHQYYLDPDVTEEARKDPPPTRIVAYGKPGMSGPIGPQSACGGGGQMRDGVLTWGCKQFMEDEDITVPQEPEPAGISLPNPFPPFTDKQISILSPGRGDN